MPVEETTTPMERLETTESHHEKTISGAGPFFWSESLVHPPHTSKHMDEHEDVYTRWLPEALEDRTSETVTALLGPLAHVFGRFRPGTRCGFVGRTPPPTIRWQDTSQDISRFGSTVCLYISCHPY